MFFLLKYLVIYPLVYLIGLIDLILGLSNSNKKKYFKNVPQNPPYSVQVDKSDPSSPFRSIISKDLVKITDSSSNLYSEFVLAVKKFKTRETMGVREVLSIEEIAQNGGKVFKKFNMANSYKWSSYEKMLQRVDSLANGLLKLGLKPNDKIVLYSETRAEWLISAMACFKIKATVVTLYATLGIDALVYGVNQTEASFIIASGESVLKVQKVADKIPKLTTVIVLTDKTTEKNAKSLREIMTKLQVFTISEVEEIGKSSQLIDNYEKPQKDDLAIIMYTSGSTGNPKGVMITHSNILNSVKTICLRLGDFDEFETFVAYLPLAHVLELVCEFVFLFNGVSIGYSNPLTLTDASTGIKEGQLGDLRVLRPTIMPGVPTVLERLSKAVKDKLEKESKFKQTLIQVAADLKLKRVKSEKSTTLLDKIIFSKISNAIFGGRMRCFISGGALLSRDVQEFGQIYFCSVLQAYGLTETCAGGTTQFGYETSSQNVGSVVPCCEIRLVDWQEGNYKCTDKPNPRGEIWIGGGNITLGYYKMPEKTAEDYHTLNGVRYFSTGDIGEILPNGNLRIIDRKKDLVKLQSGEYVSLAKVENAIKLLPFVDNCCLIANSYKNYCVCLITPNVKKIEEFLSTSHVEIKTEESIGESAKRVDLEILLEFLELLDKNVKMQEKYNKEILDHCLKQGLERFEIPTKAKFVKETWLPDSGLVTDSLKIKRKEIEKFYQKEIESIYS